ncbi:putative mannosyl-oligosaccharide alpha-1,2-mannosidase 1B [Lachnellula cervina]|uniref:alpha-1,2-Mannosidase n=1 Tax=Lachnellula cervina TaxID=1316786 RepID=A0A7D8YLU6_9HELO|nr:putative mannosyl-oligosaccharide alpha-1,2-mannosidase 1B [Lachnellula cervina]
MIPKSPFRFLSSLSLLSVQAFAARPTIVPVDEGETNTTLSSTHNTLITTAPAPLASVPISLSLSLSGYLNGTNTTTSSASPTPTSNVTLPACKSIQYAFPSGTGGNATRAAAIKEAYQYAWDAYVEYAWGYDELQPLSKKGTNDWYGWGVTVVDGIDTAIIMELTDVVSKMLGWIQSVDFTTTPDGDVEVFDTTIRYLGGLLSAYDLLKSGQVYNDYPADQIEALLTQAKILADKLAYAFLTPSGMSAANVDFSTNTPVEGTYTAPSGKTYNSTNTASAGSFLIEWYRLAALTGNTTYRSLVDTGEQYLTHPSPAPVYPGLVGTQFDTTGGGMLNYAGGWHSEVDSFLEYLIKIYHYKADNITKGYADFWLSATNSTVEHIALHPYGFEDLTFISGLDDNGVLTYTMDDYACFAGGNFLLGCKVLGIDSLCDLGIAAADGCHQTYNTTVTGLGPLYWGWFDSTNNTFPPDSAVDIDSGYRRQGAANGEFIVNGDEVYASFPESVESWWYAYRITGDPRWAEYAWDMFLGLNKTARNSVAFATVNNVDMPFGESQGDSLDSFFFAELLKYQYLTFADPSTIDLGQWVFNTESHPDDGHVKSCSIVASTYKETLSFSSDRKSLARYTKTAPRKTS